MWDDAMLMRMLRQADNTNTGSHLWVFYCANALIENSDKNKGHKSHKQITLATEQEAGGNMREGEEADWWRINRHREGLMRTAGDQVSETLQKRADQL